jgi:hypothetical protein
LSADWEELPLFRPARARRRDAISSHLAADALEREKRDKKQLKQVLALVRRYPGRSSKMLATLGRVDRYMVARRAPELAEMGLIRRVEEKGEELKWWPDWGHGR